MADVDGQMQVLDVPNGFDLPVIHSDLLLSCSFLSVLCCFFNVGSTAFYGLCNG